MSNNGGYGQGSFQGNQPNTTHYGNTEAGYGQQHNTAHYGNTDAGYGQPPPPQNQGYAGDDGEAGERGLKEFFYKPEHGAGGDADQTAKLDKSRVVGTAVLGAALAYGAKKLYDRHEEKEREKEQQQQHSASHYQHAGQQYPPGNSPHGPYHS